MSAAKSTLNGSGLDEALLLRVRHRDPAAMGLFFEHFYDRVFGYLASLVIPSSDRDLTGLTIYTRRGM